jgi:hypothetical protein
MFRKLVNAAFRRAPARDRAKRLTPQATAVSWGPVRIDIFAEGTNGNLKHRWFDGAWHPWEQLATGLTAGPGVSSWAPGRLDVFWAGSGNRLHHMWWDGSWNGPENLGGAVAGAVNAVSWASLRTDIFAEGGTARPHRAPGRPGPGHRGGQDRLRRPPHPDQISPLTCGKAPDGTLVRRLRTAHSAHRASARPVMTKRADRWIRQTLCFG